MNRMNMIIFEGIRWSCSDVLAQTIQKFADLSLKHELISEWYDIDKGKDRERLQSQAKCREVAMKNTIALLKELKQRGKL